MRQLLTNVTRGMVTFRSPAVRFLPAHLLRVAVVEDEAERGVLQRQVGDKLGDALPDRVVGDELGQADLRDAAERLPDAAAQRLGIDVDLLEERGRVRFLVGGTHVLAVDARLAHRRVQRALHGQPDGRGGGVEVQPDRDVFAGRGAAAHATSMPRRMSITRRFSNQTWSSRNRRSCSDS